MSSVCYTQGADTHRRAVRSTREPFRVSLFRTSTRRRSKGFLRIKTTIAIIILIAVIAGLGFRLVTADTRPTSDKHLDAFTYTPPTYTPPTYTDPLNADAIWAEVQAWRMSEGKPVYIKDPMLCEFAQRRLEETKLDWSHDGFWDEPCPNCTYWGENLAKGFISADAMLQAWLDSPKHFENLDSPVFTHACIAYDSGYVVHIFGAY